MEDNNRWRSINPGRKAVWTCKPEREEDVVNSKILSVFDNIKSFPLERIIIQFWRPLKTRSGTRLLSCAGNPHAVSLVNRRLCKYRSCCSKYYYGIDDMLTRDPMIINAAPPSTAFLSGFPEVVSDLRIHRGTPLVDLALECELTCFMMMPVFCQTSSSCVGVIEVSTALPARLALIFNDLKRQLKKLDFTIRPPDASLQRVDFAISPPDAPLQAVTNDLHPSLAEITTALLEISFHSHAITLCQVWMPFVNYCLGTRYTRMLLRRLDAFISNVSDDDPVKLFYDDLDVLPFKMGEGLIGRTLVTQRPHLCRNIHKLSDNRGVLALLSANAKCTSSFVICLRSSHTRELDYVFEFFWPSKHNHFALIEKLLLTLKEHLPSFKHDSGVRLGDELLIVDVDDTSLGSGSGSGGTPVKIFPKNKLSEPMGMKRKSANGEVDEGDNDDDDLVILALYKVDHSLLFMPSSTTFKSFMKKVYQEFELNPAGTYKMEYQVLPGEWFGLTNDKSLKKCISSYQTLENIDHIKLCVQAVEK